MMIPPRIVLDASVVVKRLLKEEDSKLAARLFELLLRTPLPTQIYQTELLTIECANILWKRVGRGEIDHTQARRKMQYLLAAQFTTIPLSTILPTAFDIALQEGITVYDASYLALARLIDAPLVTADKRLFNRLTGKSLQPYLLEDYVKKMQR